MPKQFTRRWSVYVDGAKELVEMFNDMEAEAESILTDATKKGAEIALSAAKQIVRSEAYLTGALHDSLDIKEEKTKKKTKKYWRVYSKGVKNGGVRYAFAVEAGAKGRPGVFFMRRGADENQKKIKDVIEKSITDAIGRV